MLLFFVLFIFNFLHPSVYGQDSISIDFPPGYSYIINGEIEIGEHLYHYGFQRNLETNETDGLLLEYDEEADEILLLYVYDFGYLETFMVAGVFSEGCFGIVSRNLVFDPNFHYIHFQTMELLKFDESGFYMGKVLFQTDYPFYGNLDYSFYFYEDINHVIAVNELLETETVTKQDYVSDGPFSLQMQGKAYVNQRVTDAIYITEPGYYDIEIMDRFFFYEIHVQVNPQITGIQDKEIAEGSVAISSTGECLLNQETYQSGTPITRAGNYLFEVYGTLDYHKQITFTILPTIEGVTDGDISKNAKRITANATSLYINNEEYHSELISQPGVYELTVFGVGDYQKSIHFTILPSVEGVENDKDYSSPIHIKINGEGYINGQPLSSEMDITQTGSYLLQLMMSGEVVEEVYFTLSIPSVQDEIQETIDSHSYMAEIVMGLLVLLGLFLFFKKK